MTFKPLLAATAGDLNELFDRHGPLLASPKLDGVRCLIVDGVAMSRNFKPIPNAHVQSLLAGAPPLDGELIVGDARHPQVFQTSQSGVMSREGRPQVTFWVFDRYDLDEPFHVRLDAARLAVKNHAYMVKPGITKSPCKFVAHKLLTTPEQLREYEATQLLAGFEGVMLRLPSGHYKHGRSTLREGTLVKVKRFADSEAVVLGCKELMTNGNEAKQDALGHQVRSSHKLNMVGANKLGALIVRDVETGVEFDIGTGFDDAMRVTLWAERGTLPGRVLTYKYQPTGVKEKPRFPVFKAWYIGTLYLDIEGGVDA